MTFFYFACWTVKNVLLAEYSFTTKADTSLIASMALWGAVLGQIVFGGCADYLGRRFIFMTTITLITFGSLGAAFCMHTDSFSIYHQLAICLFVLGFGVGGEYPLSATVTSESSSPQSKGRMMAIVFSMQGVGNVLASLVMFIVLTLKVKNDLAWRIGLGFGALPGLLAFYSRFKMHETDAYVKAKAVNSFSNLSYLSRLSSALRVYWRELVGTAVCWFLLDVTFYGNSLFSSTITSAMGLGESLTDQAKNSLFVSLMALPGYWLTIAFLDRVGRRNLQWIGFASISILYFVLGAFFDSLTNIKPLFLILYGLTFLFSNFGPNATTYIIPGEFFPPQVRATCHGLSAASGKLGAALTSYAFPHLQDAINTDNLLLLCCGVGVLGSAWTLFFVPQYTPEELPRITQMKLQQYNALIAKKDGQLTMLTQ